MQNVNEINVNDNKENELNEACAMLENVEEVNFFEAHKTGLIVAAIAVAALGVGVGVGVHMHNKNKEQENADLELLLGTNTVTTEDGIEVTSF